jgi:hypothetical protein
MRGVLCKVRAILGGIALAVGSGVFSWDIRDNIGYMGEVAVTNRPDAACLLKQEAKRKLLCVAFKHGRQGQRLPVGWGDIPLRLKKAATDAHGTS